VKNPLKTYQPDYWANVLVLLLWSLTFLSSVIPFPRLAMPVWILIVVFAIARSPAYGMVISLMMLFNHPLALGIPYPFQLVAFVTVMSSLCRPGYFPRYLFQKKALIVLATFMIWSVITVAWSADRTRSTNYLLLGVNPFLAYFVTGLSARDPGKVETIERFWVAWAALGVVVGFFHWFMGEGIPIRAAMIQREIDSQGIVDFVDAFRWKPAHKEANYYGLTLLFPLALSCKMVVDGSKVAVFAMWAILLGAAMSLSRTAILLSAIIVFLVALVRPRLFLYTLVPAIPVLFVFSLFQVEALVTLSDRVFSIGTNIRESGGSGRFSLWSDAIVVFSKNPLTGIGWAAFPTVQQYGFAAHNTLLEVAASTGVVGVILYAMAFRAKTRLSAPQGGINSLDWDCCHVLVFTDCFALRLV
jgi:O-antigen ligase